MDETKRATIYFDADGRCTASERASISTHWNLPARATCAQRQNALADTTKGTNPDGLLALWRRSAALDDAPAREDADSLLKTSLAQADPRDLA